MKVVDSAWNPLRTMIARYCPSLSMRSICSKWVLLAAGGSSIAKQPMPQQLTEELSPPCGRRNSAHLIGDFDQRQRLVPTGEVGPIGQARKVFSQILGKHDPK